MSNQPNINQQDVEGFKEIRNQLGEQITNSEINLDAEAPKSKEEYPETENSTGLIKQDSQDSDYLMKETSQTDNAQQTAFLKKLGMDIDDARPNGAQILKSLKYFSLGVKIEVTLQEMNYVLFMCSTIEFLSFFFGFIFFTKVKGMNTFWMFLPHVVRAIVGLKLWKSLPLSHDVVQQLGFDQEYDPDDEKSQFQDGDSAIGFKEMHKRIKISMERIFYMSYRKYDKIMKAYFSLTVLSLILDFFAFIGIMSQYGTKGQEYQEMTLMGILTTLYMTNLVWIGFIILLYFKFPPYITENFVDALSTQGIKAQGKVQFWTNKAHEKMGKTAKRVQSQASQKWQDRKSKKNEQKAEQNSEQ